MVASEFNNAFFHSSHVLSTSTTHSAFAKLTISDAHWKKKTVRKRKAFKEEDEEDDYTFKPTPLKLPQ
jgi:hypothetical protein